MTAAAWESLGVVAATVLTGIGLLYTVAARPKIRTFYDIAYQEHEGEWIELGAILYVANVGRAPTVLRSAGLRTADGNVEYKAGFPASVETRFTAGTAPMVLKAGDLVAYFNTDWPTPGTTEAFGVEELRTWRFGRAAGRLPRAVVKALPAFTKSTWHGATGPERESTEPAR